MNGCRMFWVAVAVCFLALNAVAQETEGIIISFKPGARIELAQQGETTVMLHDIADVRVDTPPAKRLAISTYVIHGFLKGSIPRGWDGIAPVPLKISMLHAGGYASGIGICYVTELQVEGPFNQQKSFSNPGGKPLMCYPSMTDEDRRYLGTCLKKDSDGREYPELPFASWADSVFAMAARNPNVQMFVSFRFNEEIRNGALVTPGSYDYFGGNEFFNPATTDSRHGPQTAWFSTPGDGLQIIFLPGLTRMPLFEQESVTFDLTDSALIHAPYPIAQDLYFKFTGKGRFAPEWRLTGKIPKGWKQGEPIIATASSSGELQQSLESYGCLKSYTLYTDPEMTQIYCEPGAPEWKYVDRGMPVPFPVEDVSRRCKVTFQKSLEQPVDTPVVHIEVVLSEALPKPLKINFEFDRKYDPDTCITCDSSSITVAAGDTSVVFTLNVDPNRSESHYYSLKLSPRVDTADLRYAYLDLLSYYFRVGASDLKGEQFKRTRPVTRRPKVVLNFKPDARVELPKDSSVTVMLHEIADVIVPKPLANPLTLSAGYSDKFSVEGVLPQGWNGDSQVAVTFTWRTSKDEKKDSIILRFAHFHLDDGTHTVTTTGKSMMLHMPVTDSMRARLPDFCMLTENGYIPKFDLAPWNDSVFVERTTPIMIYDNGEHLCYSGYNIGYAALSSEDLLQHRRIRHVLDVDAKVQFIPRQGDDNVRPSARKEIPIGRGISEFDFAEYVTLWMPDVPVQDLYFRFETYVVGLNPNRNPVRIFGKIPAGWQPGDSIMVSAVHDVAPKGELVDFYFLNFKLYSDPAMTQPYPSKEDHQIDLPWTLYGIEEVDRPVLAFEEKSVILQEDGFPDNADSEGVLVPLTLKLSERLAEPLTVQLVFEDDKAPSAYRIEDEYVMFAAGTDTAVANVRFFPTSDNRSALARFIIKLNEADLPRVCLPRYHGCWIFFKERLH